MEIFFWSLEGDLDMITQLETSVCRRRSVFICKCHGFNTASDDLGLVEVISSCLIALSVCVCVDVCVHAGMRVCVWERERIISKKAVTVTDTMQREESPQPWRVAEDP